MEPDSRLHATAVRSARPPLRGNAIPALWPMLCIAAWAVPLSRWLYHTGNPFDYLLYNAPAGQIPYILSRLCALLALGLLMLQFAGMLLGKAGLMRRPSLRQHIRLGVLTVLAAIAHALLFTAAKSLRGGHIAWGTLVPQFDHGYYAAMVSVGILALALMLLVPLFGRMRLSERAPGVARWGHRLSFVVAALVLIHCFAVGSEL